MRIEYVANKSQRTVSDDIGNTLIARKLARRVYETRELSSNEYTGGEPVVVDADGPEVKLNQELEEISPRTGKPKRRYKRRDLTAEG